MEPYDQADDESAPGPLLPPDDRLWRHPSELALVGAPRSSQGPAPSVAGAPPTCSTVSRVALRFSERVWTIALLSGVVGALLATGVVYAVGGTGTRRMFVPALEREVASPVATLASTQSSPGLVTGAQRVRLSCVVIFARDTHGTRISNGVVFRSDGMLLTAAHAVVGARSLTAVVDGTRRVSARLVASDATSDLAVVKLAGGGFDPAPMGSALDLRVGDPVMAVHPPSQGSDTGDVAGDEASVVALGQHITAGTAHIVDLVKLDMDEPPATVGSPLLDSHGAVVAITTALGSQGKPVAYATPVDLAREIAAQLMTSGRVVPVWLGIAGEDLTPAVARLLGVSGGAVIEQVYAGSPGAAAGIRGGDIVIGVDGREVTSMANLIMAVHARPPGTPVELDLERGSVERSMRAIVAPRPADGD